MEGGRNHSRSAGKGLKIDLRPAIEMVGLGEVLEQIGIDRVIEQIGEKEILKQIGLDGVLASLSTAQLQELKRRLH